MMLTRVALSPRLKAAVNKAHIAALKARLRRKKDPRTRNSTTGFAADKEKKSEMCEASVEVRAVVVLEVPQMISGTLRSICGGIDCVGRDVE